MNFDFPSSLTTLNSCFRHILAINVSAWPFYISLRAPILAFLRFISLPWMIYLCCSRQLAKKNWFDLKTANYDVGTRGSESPEWVWLWMRISFWYAVESNLDLALFFFIMYSLLFSSPSQEWLDWSTDITCFTTLANKMLQKNSIRTFVLENSIE